MWSVSQAFLRTILGPHRVASLLEFHNGDGVWQPLTVQSGEVTADRTSQTRWSLNVTVTDDARLSAYSSKLRAHRGVYVGGQVEWVPLGVYRVEDVDRSTEDGNATLSGLSYEIIVSDAAFLIPRSVRGDAESAIRELITEVIPDAFVDFRTAPGQIAPITEDQDRWGIIDGSDDDASIANSLGAEVFCDNIGRFVVADIPALKKPPAWEVSDGVLVSASDTQTRDGVKNVIVVTGESLGEGETVGPAYAFDDDPYSPTFAGRDLFGSAGPFGRVVEHYSSSAFKDIGACERAAKGRLANSLGLRQTRKFQAAPNPALVPGDVVRLKPPGERASDHVVDRVNISLGNSAVIDVDTRTTRDV